MELIKPKEITLKSEVFGEKTEKVFRLGRYPALEGTYMFGLAVEVLGSAANPAKATAGSARMLQEYAAEACKYVEAQMPNGDFIRLSDKNLINAHVPDYEMLLNLVKEAHEWNSHFFGAGRMLKASFSLMDKVKLSATKILSQYTQSSSRKK